MTDETTEKVTVNFWDIVICCECEDVVEQAYDIFKENSDKDEEEVYEELTEKYTSEWKNKYTDKNPYSVTLELPSSYINDISVILELAVDKLSEDISWLIDDFDYQVIR